MEWYCLSVRSQEGGSAVIDPENLNLSGQIEWRCREQGAKGSCILQHAILKVNKSKNSSSSEQRRQNEL